MERNKTRLLQATIWVKHMKDRVVPEWARTVFASHPQARVATASEQSDNNREESNAIVQIRCLSSRYTLHVGWGHPLPEHLK